GPRPTEELYDLKNDPHQMINLARQPEHEASRSALRAQLMAELTTHKDPRLEGDQFDYPPYSKIGLPRKTETK
ncbi:sulfatase, partial [bacterium]|nr:sulfatase [bacterium]